VIDIQDKLRVLEMLSYFADVIAQFKKLKITPAINIFLHKYDPEYVENNQIGINALVSELKEKIETIVDKQFDLSFHKTTTKRMWSIINAFSQIMLSLYPQSKLIDKLISDFVNKTEAKAMVILDYNSLVIGQSYTDEYYQELVQISAPYFLTLSDNFSTKLSTLKNQPPDKSKIDLTDGCDEIIEKDECINANKRLTITRSGEKYIFDEFTLLKFKNPMYILMIAGDKEISDEELNSFIKVFKNYI